MTASTNLQYVQPYDSIHPQVNHMAEHDCVTIRAHDDDGSDVCMYFVATDTTSELDAAEQWLRTALEAVQVAKMERANAPTSPCVERVGSDGCSGFVYLVNRDAPEEGTDIRHDVPCAAHPDAMLTKAGHEHA